MMRSFACGLALSCLGLSACNNNDEFIHEPSGGGAGGDASTDVVLGAGGAAGSSGAGGSAGASEFPKELSDAIEKDLADSNIAGMAVAIVADGKLKYAKGFGDSLNTGAVGVNTLFNGHAMALAIEGIAAMKLSEEGKLDLEAPVTQYLPGFAPTKGAQWTPQLQVQDLLGSTSGLSWYFATTTGPDDSLLTQSMSDSKILYNVWIQFEPGVMSFFSVFDASVAGAVIESAAGSYYKDYVTTALLPALGMTRSVFMDDQVKADPDLAFGEKALIPTMTTNALYRPIAGLYLSITDAARLAEFLLNGNTAVMSDSTRQELVKPRMPGSPAPEASGLAYTHAMGMEGIYDWLKQQQLPYAVHSDDYIILGEGYASEMVLIPSRGFALITLSNATAGLVTTSTKQAVLRTILSLDDVAPFPYGNWEPEYEKYEGTYERPSYATPVVVSQIDGGLHLTKPSSVDCTPGYAQTFLCKPPFQESVWFVRIDGGPAEYLATSKWVARRSDAADAGADQ